MKPLNIFFPLNIFNSYNADHYPKERNTMIILFKSYYFVNCGFFSEPSSLLNVSQSISDYSITKIWNLVSYYAFLQCSVA